MITSVGYAGTIEDDDWSVMAPQVGVSRYGVAGYGDWRPTIGSGTRAVSIAAGVGFGRGVRDTSSAQETVSLTSTPTGSRWDLIVARRNWATRETTFEVVQGGSSKALPTRVTNPGVLDEQPIALARVVAGQSTVQELVDLRVIPANGAGIAFDALARSYMNFVGSMLLIGGVLWTRDVQSGSPAWIETDLNDTGWIINLGISVGGNWDMSSHRLRRQAGRVEGRVVVTYNPSGSAPSMDSKGSFSNPGNILRMPVGWRATANDTAPTPNMRGVNTAVPFFPSMDDAGLVTVDQGIPGNPLTKGGRYIIEFDYRVD